MARDDDEDHATSGVGPNVIRKFWNSLKSRSFWEQTAQLEFWEQGCLGR